MIKKAGGEVLDETLPAVRKFLNADYVFRSEQVVVELKKLEEDKTVDPKFGAKLATAFRRLMREGRAPILFGRNRVSIEDIARIDPRAALEFTNAYKDRLQAPVSKASSQIQQTKAALKLPDAKGMLLLVNDGDKAFELDMVVHILSRLLKSQYGHINEVIYITVNETCNVPGHNPAARIWVPLAIEGRPQIDQAFGHRLYETWCNHMATITGEPVLSQQFSEAIAHFEGRPVKLNNGRRIQLRL